MKDARTITIGIRLTPEEKEKLDAITDYYKSNQSSVLRRMIEQKYWEIEQKKEQKIFL